MVRFHETNTFIHYCYIIDAKRYHNKGCRLACEWIYINTCQNQHTWEGNDPFVKDITSTGIRFLDSLRECEWQGKKKYPDNIYVCNQVEIGRFGNVLMAELSE